MLLIKNICFIGGIVGSLENEWKKGVGRGGRGGNFNFLLDSKIFSN